MLNINTLKKIKKKSENYKIFIAYYINKIRLIDNIQFKKQTEPNPKKDKKPITSVIVVTNTLDANAGSIFIFFRETGTNIPNKPATIIFKIIETPISRDKFISLNHN